MPRVLVIAEIGSCHGLDLDRAFRLIEIAKECDADAAKFQFWSSPERMASRRHAPALADIYRAWQLPLKWLPMLKAHADALKIEFMCSTYLPEDVPVVEPLVQRFKIASFEANDDEHLIAHADFKKPVIVSCGLGAEQFVIKVALPDVPVSTLHCVSAYPAPIQYLRLCEIVHHQGLSDHSSPEHTLTGAVAVGWGAGIIERHLRSDDISSDNPDYGHAMAPDGFAQYVRNVRFAEIASGEGDSTSNPAEDKMRAYRV